MVLKIPKIEPINKKSTTAKATVKKVIDDKTAVVSLSGKKKVKDFGKGTIESAVEMAKGAGFDSMADLLGDKKNLDNSKNKSSWGGKRENSGRPEGSLNKTTIEDKAAMDYIRDRVERNLESLIGKQLSLANGIQMLFKIEKWRDADGNEKKSKPVLVTSQSEIEQYLDGEFEGDPDADYYFMTTERPDNRALDSLLDRAYGKPKQSLDLGVTKSLEDILRERRAMKEKNDKV